MKTNPSLVALLIFLGMIAIYTAVIGPLSSSLAEARGRLSKDEQRLTAMQTEVTMKSVYQSRIGELETSNRANRNSWITPMLNSYAMRGKSFLDALAQESGLTNVEYTEGTFRALPVPKAQLPERRTARRSVRIRARGDYSAVASFLLRVEKEFPLVCLQSLSLTPPVGASGGEGGDRELMDMALEWPCEGEVIR